MKTEVTSNGEKTAIQLTPENDFEKAIVKNMNLHHAKVRPSRKGDITNGPQDNIEKLVLTIEHGK